MSDDNTDEGHETAAQSATLTAQELTQHSAADLAARLAQLRQEHRHLDCEVSALQSNGVSDMLKIARMKKMKLRLKDQIALLEDQITPDIIA